MDYTLTDWTIVAGAYDAPELGVRLHGMCPERGRHVLTSPVQSSAGRVVRTVKSTYTLVGDPNPDYAQWWDANGHIIDPNNPTKVRNC